MIHLAFQIRGPAVGKQISWRVIQPKGDVRPFAQAYTPPKVRKFMATVKAQAQLAVLEAKLTDMLPTDDALAMEIVAFFTRPESAPPSRKWPSTKSNPDASNIQKAVEDALHGVVFFDDSRVVSIKTDKRYCLPDMEPHTRVEVWTAGTKRYEVRRLTGAR